MNDRDFFKNELRKVGIEIGGSRPSDVTVMDESVYGRILSGGTLALGESYMEGAWECEDLSEFFNKILRNFNFHKIDKVGFLKSFIVSKFWNFQTGKRAYQVGEEHYDLGNDLYEMMLDKKTRSYTCAYYNGADISLEESQVVKLDLICRKLGIQKGDRILDIGCGWGNFMKYAAENYGAVCTGLSVSKEQIKLGEKLCAGLPVTFIYTNYQDYTTSEKFDHIVSIEMFEAVGRKNFKSFFLKVKELLSDDGLFLLQTIASNNAWTTKGDPWIGKYIFPNGELPSLSQITSAIESKNQNNQIFVVEDVHNIGSDYDKTLMQWWRNFDSGYESLYKENPKYDKKFYRMWKFYLQYCAGMFRSRFIQDYQIIFSKKGMLGGYISKR